MDIFEKTIPLEILGLHEDEKLMGVRLSDGKIVLSIAMPAEESVVVPAPAKPKLGDWGRKWAGAMVLDPGETRESLRSEAMQQKFGV